MKKAKITPDRYWYPRPAVLLGVKVDGKPNFMAVGGGGVVNAKPPMIAIPIMHVRYSLVGIRQNMTFSVNTPSRDQVREVDYCGIVSGRDAAKADGVRLLRRDADTAVFSVGSGEYRFRVQNSAPVRRCRIFCDSSIIFRASCSI